MKNKSQISLPKKLGSEYRPLMPLKKLRKNLIEITPKTYGKAMGDINRFLSKDTYQLHGFYNKKIGERVVNVDGYRIIQNVYSEVSTPNYAIIEGYCDYHWLHLERKKNPNTHHFINNPPILAINFPFGTGCIPIHFGDRYKIFGNRLVIYHKYNKTVADTPWLRYDEFIHSSEPFNEADKLKYEHNGRIGQIFNDFMYEFDDCFNAYYGVNPKDISVVSAMAEDLHHAIVDKLNTFIENYIQITSKLFKINIYKMKITVNGLDDCIVNVAIDMEKYFDPKFDIDKIVTFKGINSEGEWESNDFISAVRNTLHDWIMKMNKQHEEEKAKDRVSSEDSPEGYEFWDYFDCALDDLNDEE